MKSCTRFVSLLMRSLNLFKVANCKTKTCSKRAFAVAGPSLLNSLPISLRKVYLPTEFKCELKTFLISDFS